MKFSERKGYKKASDVIQVDHISDELRASIWNVLYVLKWRLEDQYGTGIAQTHDELKILGASLWMRYFKKPADRRPMTPYEILDTIRNYFFKCQWYEVYDFVEFILNHYNDEDLNLTMNNTLEHELSGYRFIEGIFSNITDKDEIDMLSSALRNDDFPAVSEHLKRSLELLSNRENPDYRNSIKESISAVESISRIISGNPKATLSDAMKVIEKKEIIHPALRDGFLKLYGFTSDKGGIRHSMLEDPNLSNSDAKYFLISCTAFINYLKSKM